MTYISLIISTAPGRESHLERCLKQLIVQNFSNFEVIVVDDGSLEGEKVCFNYKKDLNIQYHWRANDCCVSFSRNKGFELSQSEKLIFIDADILLNQRAIYYYFELLNNRPESIIYGYYGNLKNYLSPSLFDSKKWVNWLDERFIFRRELEVTTYNGLFRYPQKYAWSGNFALNRHGFEVINGFDETYIGWGHEDVDFAHRAINQGISICFSVDVWAEHQYHQSNDKFHQITSESEDDIKDKLVQEVIEVNQVDVICNYELQSLSNHIKNSYMPKNIDLEQESLFEIP